MIKKELEKLVREAAKKTGIKLPKILITASDYGDYATQAALTIKNGRKPSGNAEVIIKNLPKNKIIQKTEEKNGFINFYLSNEFLGESVKEIIKGGSNYGKNNLKENKSVEVEFISANPTGPLTVGNSRGGVIGDVLANVLESSGWKVIREYYFNDAGGQIDILGHSVLKDKRAEYRGEYIDKLHKEIQEKNFRKAGEKAAQIIINEIKKTTLKMGIKFDVWTAEGKDLRKTGKLEEIINWLKEKKLAYKKDGALWFRSTKYDDDKDRVLIRSNGEPTYFALDCAYHQDKFITRKFNRVIDIWGADHHGDLARVKGFVKALGYEKQFAILVHQFVRVIKDGKEVRMSKRAGNYILVDDLLDEVGRDVYRFFMLQYAPESHLTFDFELAKKESKENPVYYLQYATARIAGILRKLPAISYQLSAISFDSYESALVKELIKFPDLISEISHSYEVHHLPHYGIRLAKKFHQFYKNCPVIRAESEEVKNSRIALIKATQIVLKNTLKILGISAPEKM